MPNKQIGPHPSTPICPSCQRQITRWSDKYACTCSIYVKVEGLMVRLKQRKPRVKRVKQRYIHPLYIQTIEEFEELAG